MLCQNEGYLSFYSDLKIKSDHKLRHVSHIYSGVQTSRPNEMALASYNGLYFVKFEEENNELQILVNEERYFESIFVNKIVEYETDKILVSLWDSTEFKIINRNTKQI